MQIVCVELSKADARKQRWSGIRSDRILHNVEIWLDGICRGELSEAQMAVNPNAFKDMYIDIMQLHPDTTVVVTR